MQEEVMRSDVLSKIEEIETIVSAGNSFELIGKFSDNFDSPTLLLYENIIQKYIDQDNSKQITAFRKIKVVFADLNEYRIKILNELNGSADIKDFLLREIDLVSKIDLEDKPANVISVSVDTDDDDDDAYVGNDVVQEDEDEDDENFSGDNGRGIKWFVEQQLLFLNNLLKDSKNKKFSIKDGLEKSRRIKKEFNEDMKMLGLVEYLYMTKYDRHIKKEIFQSIKKRFFVGKSTYNPLQDPNLFERLKDEALSFATEGYLIGIRRYRTSSKNKLITYVTWWIKQRIVSYIEKYSSINKGYKTTCAEEDIEIEVDDDTGFIKFNRYANIKFENYNFIKTEDVGKYDELERLQMVENGLGRHNGKIFDILIFFCRHSDIFLYFEYLLIKYDILLEEYIYFIEISRDEEIAKCFHKQINEVSEMLKMRGYPELGDINGIKEYHKLPEALKVFFGIEKSEYLAVKRVLKQKLVNILKNVFVEKKKRKAKE